MRNDYGIYIQISETCYYIHRRPYLWLGTFLVV